MSVRAKRGTRADINTAAATAGLKTAELMYVTDEAVFAIALSTSTYVTLPVLVKASAADIRAGTDDAEFVTSKGLLDAMAYVAFTSVIDLSAGINFAQTLTANVTIPAPTNAKEGQTGVFALRQDGTGGRTASWNTFWDFGEAGTPTLTAGANKTSVVTYVVLPGAGSARCGFNGAA